MATLNATFAAGDLTIDDTAGVINAIQLLFDGSNYVLIDANESFVAPPPVGELSNGGRTLTIPATSLTGSLTLNLGGEADGLLIEFTGGDAIPNGGVFLNGGAPIAAPGDALFITGGSQGTVTYNYTNSSDGSVTMSNYGTVTYTGLEPIVNSGTASDIIFNLPAGADPAVLEDDGVVANGRSRLRSTTSTFETTTFAHPTGSITVNGGVGDTLAIGLVDSLGAADASITGFDAISVDNIATSGNVTLGASGAVTESPADVATDISAATLTITAGTGIGSGGPLETNVATLDLSNSTSGNIQLNDADAVTVNQLNVAGTGTITLGAGGTITIAAGQSGVSAGSGTVTLAAIGPTSNVAVNAPVTSVNGPIQIWADNNVSFSAAGDVTSNGGAVEVTADFDNGGAASGSITMANGAVINAGSGPIDLNADGNITIGSVRTTSSSATAITIDTNEGAIVDGGDSDVDIIADSGTVVINAITGVGNGNSLETTVGTIDVDNATSGDIGLIETNSIIVNKLSQTTAGNISLTVTPGSGTITVAAGQSGVTAVGAGTVLLFADGGSGDLTVNAPVSSVSGNINLRADRNVTIAAAGDVTSTSGNIDIRADFDNATSGALQMTDGAVVDAGSGTVLLRSRGNLLLSNVTTTNATPSAVSITVTNGALVDNGDTDVDISANSGTVTISASSSIGSVAGAGATTAIDTQVGTLAATANAGSARFVEADGLTIQSLTASGAGSNADLVNTTGSIQVTSISGTGGVILAAAESAGTDNVVLSGSSSIASSSGSVSISAGDDVTIPAGAVVSASTTITVTVDSGSTDAGGGTVNFAGDVDATSAIFRGSSAVSQNDTFNIRPDQDSGASSTPITVQGFNPTSAPGDTLNLDITSLTSPANTVNGTNDGGWLFGNAAAVNYVSIETVTSAPPATSYGLIVDMEPTLKNGNGAADDTIDVRRNGTDLEVRVNGTIVFTGPEATISALVVLGSNQNDTLTITETASGLPQFGIPAAAPGSHVSSAFTSLTGYNNTTVPINIHFDGRTGVNALSYSLTTSHGVVYTSDNVDSGKSGNVGVATNGAFTTRQLGLSFENLAPITLVGAGGSLVVDASSSPAADVTSLTIIGSGVDPVASLDAGTSADGASVIYPNSGSTTFEPTKFSGFSTLTVRSGLGSDTIDLVSIDGPTTVTLDGDDTANADSSDDLLKVQSTPVGVSVTLLGGAGNDTFQVHSNSNSTDSIRGAVSVSPAGDEASGNDTLILSDTNDVTGDTITVTSTTIDGIFDSFGGTDVTYNPNTVDVVDLISSSGNDTINVNFGGLGGAALDTVNLSGGFGADLLLIQSNTAAGAFTTLNGNQGTDTFEFAAGNFVLNGRIDGGSQQDKLRYNNYATARSIGLTGLGTSDGFTGQDNSGAPSITPVAANSFDNIDWLDGTAFNDTLTGADLINHWDIDATNQGTIYAPLDLPICTPTTLPAPLPPGALQVTRSNNVTTLINALTGAGGAGLQITNVQLTGRTSGAAMSTGTFTVGQIQTYGLERNGIVLSTGDIANYFGGPNTSPSRSTAFGVIATPAQEALLDPITGGSFTHFDVSQLDITFNVLPGFTNLYFDLTFGSEEYPEYVATTFIDGFGIYLNGTNIAFTGGSPININHPNFIALAGSELDGVVAPGGDPILRFSPSVTPGSTNNTLTIIIADASDAVYDSTVYISALGGSAPVGPAVHQLRFTTIENLVGAQTQKDLFDLRDGAGLTGSINGRGGNDTIDYRDYTSSVNVNLLTGSATNIGGGLVAVDALPTGGSDNNSIENACGGQNNDTVVGDNDHNILGDGPATDSLDGDDGNDRFLLEPGAVNDGSGASNDTLTDISGSDTVDFSNADYGVTIDMDLVGVAQDVFLTPGPAGLQNVTLARTGGQTALMASPFESVTGSIFNDVFHVDVLSADGNLPTLGAPVFRLVDGNQPPPSSGVAPVPPGDTLDFDGFGQPVLDTGAVLTINGIGSVYYNSIETLTIYNNAPRVLDNGDADFELLSGPYAWSTHEQSASGYQGDAVTTYDGAVGNKARWTFHGVTPGVYRVSTTFPLDPDQMPNVPFSVFDDTRLVTIAPVDQMSPPSDYNQFGAAWDQLGVYPITSHTLVIELSDPTNAVGKYLAADAVRVERLSFDLPTPTQPELRVQEGDNYITDYTGSVAFDTTIGTDLTKVITVTNEAPVGGPNLVITAVDLGPGTGYSVTVAGGLPLTLNPGDSAPIVVTLSGASYGEFRNQLRIFSNDPDENVQVTEGTGVDASNAPTTANDRDPFTFTLAGRVATSLVIDDSSGASRFALTGAWTSGAPGTGVSGTTRIAAADGTGDAATWTSPTLPAGKYRVSTTWTPSAANATGVKYEVNGVLLGASYNQSAAPNDLTANGASWEDLYATGAPLVLAAPSTIAIRLLDSPAQAGRSIIADAVRIERLSDLDVQVTVDGGTNVADDSGVVTYPTTDIGQFVSKTFVITNSGVLPLSLGASITVPEGFELTSDTGETSLAVAATRTFVLRYNAGQLGTVDGIVSFSTGDDDENPFNFKVVGTVSNIRVIDDGDAGFSQVGTWTSDIVGMNSDSLRRSPGTGTNTTTWTFTGLAAGFYQVSATWPEKIWENTATANYVVTGSDPAQLATIDQRYAPNDLTDGSTQWEHLGLPIRVASAGGTITVTLSDNQAANLAVADAIRIERLIGPEIVLLDATGGGTVLADGSGSINLGATTVGGAALNRTIEIRNYGATPLTVGQLNLPNGYVLTSSPASQLAAATGAGYSSTTFAVQLPSSSAGPFVGEVSLLSGDFNESPSTFTLDGDVINPLPTSIIIDNGDAGYADSGWVASVSSGFGGDQRQLPFNSAGATATWTFSGLTPNSAYRVSASWSTIGGASSGSPFAVYDGSVLPTNLLGSALVDQSAAPNDFTASGATWEDLGGAYRVGASGTLVVRLTNASSGTMLADAVRLDPVTASEVQVVDNTTSANVADGSGPLSLGTVFAGNSVSRTFTIRNLGGSPLTVGTPILPFGYNLTAAPATSVVAGGSTSFSIALRTDIPAGDYTGDIVFSNNDSDENLFNFRVSTTVNPPGAIIDDGDAAYSDTGFSASTPGYEGDMRTSAAGAGNTATWTFNLASLGLPNAATSIYRVSATWKEAGNLATNAPFTVNGGSAILLNQQVAPNDFTSVGAAWEDLGYFAASAGAITVSLADSPANGRVGADAIRIELITTPEINVTQGSATLTDAVSSVDFGSTPVGLPVQKTFTVTNLGAGTLTLVNPTLPAGFTLASSLSSTSLAHGQTATFTVELTAAAPGTFGGNLVLGTNDGDESPFEVTLSGVATAGNAVPVIVDNGDAGYSSTGAFANQTGSGYGGDQQLALANAGGTATWSFAGLPNGMYGVAVTWPSGPSPAAANMAPNATYTLTYGALTKTLTVDQRQLPNDFSSDGRFWEEFVGAVNYTGGPFQVTLPTTATSGWVSADAVRVVRLLTPEIQVSVGSDNTTSGTSTLTYNTTFIRDAAPTKTLTITNVGAGTLTLPASLTVPGGYQVASDTGFTALASGATRTVILQMNTDPVGDSATPGSKSGALVISGTNDSDETNYSLNLSGYVESVMIVDGVQPTFYTFGRTASYSKTANYRLTSGGYLGQYDYTTASATNTATFTLNNLPAGTYRVSATWAPKTAWATNSPFSVNGGGIVTMNQQVAPASVTSETKNGVTASWGDLTTVTVAAGGSINVVVGGALANKFVAADAIRVEWLAPQLADTTVANGAESGQSIVSTDLSPLVAEAIRRWTAVDPSAAAKLANAEVHVSHLPAGVLGLASVMTNDVWISANAAGQGWFVDRTPQVDNEFANGLSVAGLDLLSTVTHELGHLLGYGDLDANSHPLSTMAGELTAGLRRMPTAGLSLDSLPTSVQTTAVAPMANLGGTLLSSGLETVRTIDSSDLDAIAADRTTTNGDDEASRDQLFAELAADSRLTTRGGLTTNDENAGRGKRKSRREEADLRAAQEEVFARWSM